MEETPSEVVPPGEQVTRQPTASNGTRWFKRDQSEESLDGNLLTYRLTTNHVSAVQRNVGKDSETVSRAPVTPSMVSPEVPGASPSGGKDKTKAKGKEKDSETVSRAPVTTPLVSPEVPGASPSGENVLAPTIRPDEETGASSSKGKGKQRVRPRRVPVADAEACRFFVKGWCRYSVACKYRHGDEPVKSAIKKDSDADPVTKTEGRVDSDLCTPLEKAEYPSACGNWHWVTSQSQSDRTIDMSRAQRSQNDSKEVKFLHLPIDVGYMVHDCADHIVDAQIIPHPEAVRSSTNRSKSVEARANKLHGQQPSNGRMDDVQMTRTKCRPYCDLRTLVEKAECSRAGGSLHGIISQPRVDYVIDTVRPQQRQTRPISDEGKSSAKPVDEVEATVMCARVQTPYNVETVCATGAPEDHFPVTECGWKAGLRPLVPVELQNRSHQAPVDAEPIQKEGQKQDSLCLPGGSFQAEHGQDSLRKDPLSKSVLSKRLGHELSWDVLHQASQRSGTILPQRFAPNFAAKRYPGDHTCRMDIHDTRKERCELMRRWFVGSRSGCPNIDRRCKVIDAIAATDSFTAQNGVKIVKDHVIKALEPIEDYRNGQIMDDVLVNFTRSLDQILVFNLRWDNEVGLVEKTVGDLAPKWKARMYPKRMRMPGLHKSRVLACALGKSSVNAYKEAVLSMCPNIREVFRGNGASGDAGYKTTALTKYRRDKSVSFDKRTSYKVYVAEHGKADDVVYQSGKLESGSDCTSESSGDEFDSDVLEGVPHEFHEAFMVARAFVTQNCSNGRGERNKSSKGPRSAGPENRPKRKGKVIPPVITATKGKEKGKDILPAAATKGQLVQDRELFPKEKVMPKDKRLLHCHGLPEKHKVRQQGKLRPRLLPRLRLKEGASLPPLQEKASPLRTRLVSLPQRKEKANLPQ